MSYQATSLVCPYRAKVRRGNHCIPLRTIEDRGTTALELIVVVILIALFFAGALPTIKQLNNPLRNGAHEMVAFFKEARAKAMATTLAYSITPASATRITAAFAKNCAAADFSPDSSMALELPQGASLSATNWSVCFNSRGFADSSVDITMSDQTGRASCRERVSECV